ncbi:hypothetical protein [Biostraticola tofi]|uniref:Uncharacterized protein n=1 Tax=Biostraticola tofi TaxID=466109 RepID=A0A4R3YW01_9GAMM|nr:hypothetical protein [Biostraticola tofi]TCV96682.1 hypothetical protein EDC52_104122 [Biostraticola tofi]
MKMGQVIGLSGKDTLSTAKDNNIINSVLTLAEENSAGHNGDIKAAAALSPNAMLTMQHAQGQRQIFFSFISAVAAKMVNGVRTLLTSS